MEWYTDTHKSLHRRLADNYNAYEREEKEDEVFCNRSAFSDYHESEYDCGCTGNSESGC